MGLLGASQTSDRPIRVALAFRVHLKSSIPSVPAQHRDKNTRQAINNRYLMRFLYLHGFASGPHSRKALEFQRALAASQAFPSLEVPQLDEEDFGHLTISAQLEVIERTLRGDPACLVGSSLGGYLAALYASRHPEVDRLVLLAPAFGFSSRWNELTGPERMRAWRGDWLARSVPLRRRRSPERPLRTLRGREALPSRAGFHSTRGRLSRNAR